MVKIHMKFAKIGYNSKEIEINGYPATFTISSLISIFIETIKISKNITLNMNDLIIKSQRGA